MTSYSPPPGRKPVFKPYSKTSTSITTSKLYAPSPNSSITKTSRLYDSPPGNVSSNANKQCTSNNIGKPRPANRNHKTGNSATYGKYVSERTEKEKNHGKYQNVTGQQLRSCSSKIPAILFNACPNESIASRSSERINSSNDGIMGQKRRLFSEARPEGKERNDTRCFKKLLHTQNMGDKDTSAKGSEHKKLCLKRRGYRLLYQIPGCVDTNKKTVLKPFNISFEGDRCKTSQSRDVRKGLNETRGSRTNTSSGANITLESRTRCSDHALRYGCGRKSHTKQLHELEKWRT